MNLLLPILRLPFRAMEQVSKALHSIIKMINNRRSNNTFIVPHSTITRQSICSSKMDPPNPFPILRLPFLAIEEVFKAMNISEIINFSIISKRTKAVTQLMTLFSKYLIRINVSEKLETWVVGNLGCTECYYMFTTNQEMNGEGETNIWNGRNEVWKQGCNYSNNPVEGWKQVSKHVLELFKKKTINVLFMTMDARVDQNVSIIDFLKTNVKSVDRCNLYQSKEENDVDEHAAYLFNNLTVKNELHSHLRIKSDDFIMKIPKNLKELNIQNSQWIGYEKLLEIDCKRGILEKNLISNKEWNRFFKKWIAMETHSNLEHLELDYRRIEEFRNYVLHDIPHEVVDWRVKRVMKTLRTKTQVISGGIDIRRIDGKTATFFVHRAFEMEYFAMSVH